MLTLAFYTTCCSVQVVAANPGPDTGEREQLRHFLEQTISEADSFVDRYEAEVWLVDMSARLTPFVINNEQRLVLLREIHQAARRSQLPPELVLAVIEVESHFDRFAISIAGAQGLMQVMPFWRDEIGRPGDNLTDVRTNLNYGCRILQFYLQREDGELDSALSGYNGSTGNRKYSDKVRQAWQEHWMDEQRLWD